MLLIRSKVSRENVEKVVKPPQNPTPINSFSDGLRFPFSWNPNIKIPNITLPRRFTANVPYGKSTGNIFEMYSDIKYRNPPPSPAPIATIKNSIKTFDYFDSNLQKWIEKILSKQNLKYHVTISLLSSLKKSTLTNEEIMKASQMKKRILLISIFTIIGLLLSSLQTMAEEKILIEKNYSVESNEMLLVKISSADVEVIGWGRSEVHIAVKGNESIKDYFDFNISYNNGIVKITSEKISDWSIFSGFKDFKLKLMVPKDFNVDVKTSGGDVEVKMIDGKITLVTSGGDIELMNSKGNLSAKTSGGDIKIDNFTGNSVMKTSGGDMELNLSNGKVISETSGGDISLSYDGTNKGIQLRTSGGDISVMLPRDFNADVELKTSGGDVDNDFAATSLSEVSKNKLIGKYNNGGSLFRAKTSGGSITVDNK